MDPRPGMAVPKILDPCQTEGAQFVFKALRDVQNKIVRMHGAHELHADGGSICHAGWQSHRWQPQKVDQIKRALGCDDLPQLFGSSKIEVVLKGP